MNKLFFRHLRYNNAVAIFSATEYGFAAYNLRKTWTNAD
jgi:hypothetical protein